MEFDPIKATALLERVWGFIVAAAWAIWYWRRRKRTTAKEDVDTIEYLLRSVENLSKKYDELVNHNIRLGGEIADLRRAIIEKDATITKLRKRIDELERKSI